MNDDIRAVKSVPATGYWIRLLLCSLLAVFLIPAAALFFTLLNNDYSIAESISLLAEQARTQRRNLFLVSLPGLFPFLLLASSLALYRHWRGSDGTILMAITGSIGIAFFLVWANVSYWPLFLPGRDYPGFPHGLEMIIAPLFFAPLGMLLGIGVALLWRARR